MKNVEKNIMKFVLKEGKSVSKIKVSLIVKIISILSFQGIIFCSFSQTPETISRVITLDDSAKYRQYLIVYSVGAQKICTSMQCMKIIYKESFKELKNKSTKSIYEHSLAINDISKFNKKSIKYLKKCWAEYSIEELNEFKNSIKFINEIKSLKVQIFLADRSSENFDDELVNNFVAKWPFSVGTNLESYSFACGFSDFREQLMFAHILLEEGILSYYPLPSNRLYIDNYRKLDEIYAHLEPDYNIDHWIKMK